MDQIKVNSAKGIATITLGGKFDFSSHKEFKTAYSPLLQDAETRTILIDLANVTYVDSSALGVLMLLNEHVAEVGKSISLIRPNQKVRQILDIANMGKLFKID